MKLFTSFFAIVVTSLALSAFGQDESPSPSASAEGKASPTVEATPPAAQPPPPKEEKPAASAPAAEKKEQPEATASTGSQKKAATSSSETKKASAAPEGRPGRKMNLEAAIKDNENRWEAAIANHDVKTVEAMVAPDFMGVSSKGKFIGRFGLLSEIKSGKDTYRSCKNERLNVRAFDRDVVVVTGSAREKGNGRDGKPFDRTYRFTDTWVARNGAWQCVASQAMLLGRK